MLKKLQNLLFEDEEDDEEEYEEEEEELETIEAQPKKRRLGRRFEETRQAQVVEEPAPAPAPARPQPAAQPKPQPKPQPEPAKPVMTRVEVTQAVPAQRQEEAPQPAPAPVFTASAAPTQNYQRPTQIQHASPRPINQAPVQPQQPAPAPKPAFSRPAQASSFGISADDRFSTARPAPAPEPKPVYNEPRRPAPRVQTSQVYEFRPVISPMFGVDEKDINSMQIVATPAKPLIPETPHVKSPVLSPMNGTVAESTQPAPQPKREAPIPRFDGSAYQPKPQPQEDNPFPEFSLDDILSARDEEFTRQNVFSNDDYRTPDIDETAVIDSNRYSPYDQQTLDFDRDN